MVRFCRIRLLTCPMCPPGCQVSVAEQTPWGQGHAISRGIEQDVGVTTKCDGMCKDALREVEQWLKQGYTWIVDADIEGYFDSLPKTPLLARVAEKISDGTLLDLLQRFLDQDVLEGMQQWTPVAGVPQGSVLSPVLSNLYLHPFDRYMAQAGYNSVRYCDDFVILCRTQAEAEAALAAV